VIVENVSDIVGIDGDGISTDSFFIVIRKPTAGVRHLAFDRSTIHPAIQRSTPNDAGSRLSIEPARLSDGEREELGAR
jgi:hypothetical protein